MTANGDGFLRIPQRWFTDRTNVLCQAMLRGSRKGQQGHSWLTAMSLLYAKATYRGGRVHRASGLHLEEGETEPLSRSHLMTEWGWSSVSEFKRFVTVMVEARELEIGRHVEKIGTTYRLPDLSVTNRTGNRTGNRTAEVVGAAGVTGAHRSGSQTANRTHYPYGTQKKNNTGEDWLASEPVDFED